MNISEYVRAYAKQKNISCASIEREMGWSKDTIRKMQETELYKRRVRDLSMVYTDLYDVVPGLRRLVGRDSVTTMRDKRVHDLEEIIQTQRELIESLKNQIRILQEKGE